MDDQEITCGWSVAASFILSPTFTPDTSCLKNISVIDFNGNMTKSREMSMTFFGTEDMWQIEGGNTPAPINTQAKIAYYFYNIVFLLLAIHTI